MGAGLSTIWPQADSNAAMMRDNAVAARDALARRGASGTVCAGWNELERRPIMWLILLEALAALLLLVFLVWWTMFSGRRREPGPEAEPARASEHDIPTTRPYVRAESRGDDEEGAGPT